MTANALNTPTDPEVLTFIERTEAAYPPEANEATPAENRTYYNAMCAVFAEARPAGVSATDEIVPASQHDVPVRRYTCGGGGPLVIYLHGGGFVVGSPDSHDAVTSAICSRTGLDVISVDYRLAPEHAYPAALDDAEVVYRAAMAGDRQIVLAGDSAGGTLCAGLCLRARRLGLPQPLGQALIYPMLSASGTEPSFTDCADAPMLRAADCLLYREIYAGGPAPLDDPEFNPMAAADLTGLPPTFISVAEFDPLRDDGPAFAARLTAAGVAADCRIEPQLVHGHLRARGLSRRAENAFDAVAAAINGFAKPA